MVKAYHEDKFVIGIDAEHAFEAGFSGLDTCAGGLLTVRFKYNNPVTGGAIIDTRIAALMQIVLHADYILEIHDTDVRVYLLHIICIS